jgi:predicted DNA-binding protein YlxM (UPF0122 family)
MARSITVEQILKDMESCLILRDELLKDDVTVDDIIEHFHVKRDTAYDYMKRMASHGKYEKIKVYHNGNTIVVLRKVA